MTGLTNLCNTPERGEDIKFVNKKNEYNFYFKTFNVSGAFDACGKGSNLSREKLDP